LISRISEVLEINSNKCVCFAHNIFLIVQPVEFVGLRSICWLYLSHSATVWDGLAHPEAWSQAPTPHHRPRAAEAILSRIVPTEAGDRLRPDSVPEPRLAHLTASLFACSFPLLPLTCSIPALRSTTPLKCWTMPSEDSPRVHFRPFRCLDDTRVCPSTGPTIRQ